MYRNPSKSEVIGRGGGDEKNEWPRRTDKKSNAKKQQTFPYCWKNKIIKCVYNYVTFMRTDICWNSYRCLTFVHTLWYLNLFYFWYLLKSKILCVFYNSILQHSTHQHLLRLQLNVSSLFHLSFKRDPLEQIDCANLLNCYVILWSFCVCIS